MGTVNIDFPKSEDSVIAISISGGADSAILFHIILPELEKRNLNWKIVTGADSARPWTGPAAKKIIKMVCDHYAVKLPKHKVYGYDTTKISEADAQCQGIGQCVIDNEFNYLISGTTALPGPNFQEQIPGWPIERRDTVIFEEHDIYILPNNQVCNWSNIDAGSPSGKKLLQYRPLANVNKKWIAEEYKKLIAQHPVYGDLLFNTTISCTSYADATNNFEKPCTYCWWCQEKKWAFGCYDAGYRD